MESLRRSVLAPMLSVLIVTSIVTVGGAQSLDPSVHSTADPAIDRTPIAATNDTNRAPAEAWNRTHGNVAGSIIRTDDGGFLVGGSSYNSVADDAMLVKLHANGTKDWKQTYGELLDREFGGRGVMQTADGGYIFLGASSWDVWLVKVDANGTEQWNRTYDYIGVAQAFDFVRTADGGYLIAGHTDNEQPERLGYHVWLVKVNENGTEQWNRTYRGKAAFSIIHAPDGGYLFPALQLDAETRVMKVSENGTLEWYQHYPTAIYGIIPTNDGDYVLAGWASLENGMASLRKIHPNGTVQWTQNYSRGYMHERSIIQTTDGGYAFGGITKSENGHAWLVKVNETGIKTWEKTFDAGERIFSLVQNQGRGYTFVGWTEDERGWIVRVNGPSIGLDDATVMKPKACETCPPRSATRNVTLRLSTSASDVIGYHANLSYDPSAIEVRSVHGGDFDDPTATVDADHGYLALNHTFTEGRDGPTLATIRLRVATNRSTASMELVESNTSLVGEGGGAIPLSTYEAGTVTLEPCTLGDANRDGSITSGDAGLVLRGLVGLALPNGFETACADIRADGMLTPGDATLILREIVGLSV